MIDLRGELTAAQRAVLAIDTSNIGRAMDLAKVAREAGASIIKQGLELASAPESSWEFCSENAAEAGLDWVADAKIHDIPATTEGIVRNLVKLEHPPVAITIHTLSGHESMYAAREIAQETGLVMLGVTELTSKKEVELRGTYGFILEAFGVEEIPEEVNLRQLFVHALGRSAYRAGLGGLVASANELRNPIKTDPLLADKLTMIPGTRSKGKDTHDQQNVTTPQQAIADGADLLVIGRQVTGSEDPPAAFAEVTTEIQLGLDERLA